jgi:hypothetical protein
MFCNKCGNQLNDDAKFCWACGNSVAPAAASPEAEEVIAAPTLEPEIPVMQESSVEPVIQQPAYEPPVWSTPVEPEQPKKPRKKWMPFAIIGGAIAAVAAIVLTLFLTGVFDSDEVRLYKAIGKTTKAFAETSDAMDMPDFQYIQKENAYSAEFGFAMNEFPEYEEVCGLGIRGSMDYNLPGKKLGLILTPSYGSVDLLNVEMKLDNNMFYLGAPEITGNSFYSLNTETLFMDLSNLGGDVNGLENIRINFFELLQILSENTAFSEEDLEKVLKAAEELIKSIEAEKIGAEEITVNGYDLKCDEYEVVITKDALLDYYEVVLNIMADMDMTDTMTKLCESLNLPEEAMEQMNITSTEIDTDELMEALDEMLSQIGDIELTFYLNDGYVMAVVYELELEDAVIEFELNIGGGDNYVDDLSLTMSAGGESFVLESSGNHAGKNGKYTDETKLYFKDSGTTMTFLTSSLSFDSKKSSDNFQWTLDMDDFASVVINIAGNMSYDSKSMTMDLNDISFTQYGEELFAFSLYYKLGEYDDKIQIDESVELLKLSENEIAAEINALGEKVQEWAMGMMDQVPELLELLN